MKTTNHSFGLIGKILTAVAEKEELILFYTLNKVLMLHISKRWTLRDGCTQFKSVRIMLLISSSNW